MICIETLNISLNRILLLAVGLWPYQRTKLVQLQIILFFSIIATFPIFQFTLFITKKCTLDLIIKTISSMLFFIDVILIYNYSWIKLHNVRYLLDELQYTYNELKDENEITIIKKYAYYGKRYTIILTVLAIFNIIIIISLPISSSILSTFMFAKEIHSHSTMLFETEYFINQEKYFNFIISHMNAAISIGATVMVATGTMFIIFIKYACGIFKIASYRIEQAMIINTYKNISLEKNMIYKKMICAVYIHRKAMKLSEYLVSSFEGLFFSFTLIYVICMCLNLFQILSLDTVGNNINELLINFLFVIVWSVYMFLINYLGQEIIDHNNHVFVTAYNTRWYTAPLNVQKLILFLLQRSGKTFNLNVGSTFVASLENFGTLTSASISYFTVLYSTQK